LIDHYLFVRLFIYLLNNQPYSQSFRQSVNCIVLTVIRILIVINESITAWVYPASHQLDDIFGMYEILG